MIPTVEDILKALAAGEMPLSQAMRYIARHLELERDHDAGRLMYVMEDVDGFCNIDDDKQEVVYEVATKNGREAPNDDDRLEGARLLIDRAMGVDQ